MLNLHYVSEDGVVGTKNVSEHVKVKARRVGVLVKV